MRTQKIILLGLLLLFQSARATELFGTVDAVAGTATLANKNGAISAIVTGTRIYAGQSMFTGNDGEVHIVTTDSGLIALRPDSRLHIDQYQAQGKSSDEIVFSLLKGALRSITGWIAKRNPEAYRLHVATTTMGVRGTDHETTLIETAEPGSPPGVYDTVYEGSTVMQTTRGSIEVQAGKFGFVPHDDTQPLVLLERRPIFIKQMNGIPPHAMTGHYAPGARCASGKQINR